MGKQRYTAEIEAQMQLVFSELGEKAQRHYAAIEAKKLGYGGKKYIGELFGISQFRIRTGEKELAFPELLANIPPGRERRLGGGRKKRVEQS